MAKYVDFSATPLSDGGSTVSSVTQVIAGDGLTGGGYLAGDVTLNVGTGAGITVGTNDVQVDDTYAFVWNGYHQFQVMPTFNFGAQLGGTSSGLLSSDIGNVAGYVQFLLKPTQALTSGTDRSLFQLQDSTGAQQLTNYADGKWQFGASSAGGSYIAANRVGAEDYGINFTLSSSSAGQSFTGIGGGGFGITAGITAGLFQATTELAFTGNSIFGGTFVGNIGNAPTTATLVAKFGAYFASRGGIGGSGKTFTWNGGGYIAGLNGGKSTGTHTNWVGFYVSNAAQAAMGAGSSLVNSYGLAYVEEQTRAATINNGLFLAASGSTYKALAIRDQAAWISSNAANYLDLHAATAVRVNTGATGSILAGTAVACIFTQTDDKTVGNTTTETTLFGTGSGTLTLPANFFVAGRSVRIKLHGVHSITGAETMQIRAFLGATVVGDTTAVTEVNDTNEGWELSFLLTCRTTGATGTVATAGMLYMHEATTALDGLDMQSTAGTTYTIDTTASQVIDVKVTHGTAAAGNTITTQVASVEIFGG